MPRPTWLPGKPFAKAFPAITYVSVLALIGALSYILLVGKVERIKL